MTNMLEATKAIEKAAMDKDRVDPHKTLALGELQIDEPILVADGRLKGLKEALGLLEIEVRYNIRSARAELKHRTFQEGWFTVNDRLMARVRDLLASNFVYEKKNVTAPLAFGRDSWTDIWNNALFDVEVDPFKVRLLEGEAWDGVGRVRACLSVFFEIEDYDVLAEWVSQFLFLGPITRAFRPGTKLDETPVLIGKGGIGKSTALRYILPQDIPGLFSDGLNLAGSPQEKAESLLGRAIVEAAELAGLSKTDITSLKAFMTRTDDGNIRYAYRKNPEPTPRRCIIVGTSDVDTPLPNDSNLRRWVPIYLKGGDPKKLRAYVDEYRDQLWAEGLAMYRAGMEARLPDGLLEAQAKVTSRARTRDIVLEDKVEGWIATQKKPFALAAIAQGVGLVDIDKESRLLGRDQTRLTDTLRELGYVKKRQRGEGARQWLWARE